MVIIEVMIGKVHIVLLNHMDSSYHFMDLSRLMHDFMSDVELHSIQIRSDEYST